MYAKDYRALARQALQGKWKRTALLILLAMLLGAGAVGGTSGGMNLSVSDVEPLLEEFGSREMMIYAGVLGAVGGFLSLWSLFMGSFAQVGLMNMLNHTLDGEMPRAGMLFPKKIYWKCVGMNFLRGVYVFLWSLLFVIPGVIALYRYSMADYILATHPEMGIHEALNESKRCMIGRKWRMVCLELSFLGWELLAALPAFLGVTAAVFAAEFAVVPLMSAAVLIPLAIGSLISAAASLFVYAYLNTALTAFWRDADRAGTWRAEAREGETYARETYGEAAAPEARPQLAPIDESAARELYLRHKCSHSEMEKAGVLADYLLMHPSSVSENRWRREYADQLMRRFDQDPSALDDLLSLAAENGAADLLDRAISRIERHLRQQTLSCIEIANMCGRVLGLLNSGALDEDAGFVSRKKTQIAGMAGLLEARLQADEPDGRWQSALEMIRKLCI